MPYVRTKRIKGHDYLYQVHSVRDGKQVRQIHLSYIGAVYPEARKGQEDVNLTNYHLEAQSRETMSPEQFLKSASGQMPELFRSSPGSGFDKGAYDKVRMRMERGEPLDPLFLDVDVATGKVVSHEGRHRALAAHDLKIDQVPVVAFAKRGRDYVPQKSLKPAERRRLDEAVGVVTNPRYVERKIGKGVFQTSEEETLGGFNFMFEGVNSPIVQFAIGNERQTRVEQNVVERTYPKSGVTANYSLVYTRAARGGEGSEHHPEGGPAGRIILRQTRFRGPETPDSKRLVDKSVDYAPDGALLWRNVNGRPTIVNVQVERDSRGYGFAQELVRAFEREHGTVRFTGPFSKAGEELANRFPTGTEVVDKQLP